MMGVIQGMDTIPREIADIFVETFAEFLPGWSINGIYNFKPGATNQMAAAQLELLMHDGSHPWINNTLKKLLGSSEFQNLGSPEKVRRLSALVNFMGEANSVDALKTAGARTGGYLALASQADPKAIAKFCGKRATI